ncbi:PAS domain S-box protein [Rubrivirga sp. IMCC45206]|uniref:PAS domain S-box protein n=1 Tax=Rubrivirga sp. IMCC45206 TaxID=3391614 RepID=UPI00398FD80C
MAHLDTLLVDADGRVAGLTSGIGACLPLGPDDIGRALAEALPDHAWLVDPVRAVLAGGAAPSPLEACAMRGAHRFEARPLVGGGVAVVVADETEQVAQAAEARHTAEALQLSETRVRGLVEASTDMIWQTDADGRAIGDSPPWRAFTGQSPDDRSEGRWSEVIHPDDLPIVEQARERLLRERRPQTMEFRLHHAPSQTWRWVRVQSVPIFAPDGTFRGTVGSTVDIDEEQRAAEAVRASERRFRALVEASAETVWEADAEGNVLSETSGWEATTGQSRDEYAGFGWLAAVHPDDQAAMERTWRATVAAGAEFEHEFRVRRASDGAWRWTRSRAVPLRDADGGVEGYIGTTTDISEQREAEERLRASERRFRALVSASAEMFFQTDPMGNILPDVPEWGEFTGQSFEEYGGDGWLAAVHPDDRDRMVEAFFRAASTGGYLHEEFRVRRAADGAWRWMSGRAAPLFTDDGAFEGYVGMNLDITERKAAAAAVEASERRFRALVEASAEVVWQTDADGRWIGETPTWLAFSGQTYEEGADGGWFEAIHPDDRAVLAERWVALRGGGPADLGDPEAAFRIWHEPSGTWRWVTSRWAGVWGPDGTFEGYVGMNRDVHEEREAAEAVRASERRFRALVEVSSETVWEADADGLAIGDSPSWRAFTGQSVAEWLGMGWLDAIHPDDRAALAEAWRATVETGAPFRHEFRVRRASDGAWRWMAGRATSLRRADGAVEGYVGMNTDITERNEAAEALRASEARFRAMAETVPDILFTVETTGEVSYVNYRFSEATGIDPSAYETVEDWRATIHPDDRAAVDAAWKKAFDTGTPLEIRYRTPRSKSQYRWAIARARLVDAGHGQPPRWYGAATDIHDLVQAERALEEANATLAARVQAETERVRQLAAALSVAEQSERRRIADVLHDDLQQQLYGAAMLVAQLQREPPSDERARLLGRCDQILEDASDLARGLATDLSPPALDSSDVCDLVRWLGAETKRLHGLAVDIEADTAGPCVVHDMSVRALLYRTLRELLFNVAKHADADRAQLRVAVDAGWLRVEVEDDGRGFETTTTDDGYGLATVRERLAVAGGRLDVASEPGEGTCIRLAIPLGTAPGPREPAPTPPLLHKRFPSPEVRGARTWDESRPYSAAQPSDARRPDDLSDLPRGGPPRRP